MHSFDASPHIAKLPTNCTLGMEILASLLSGLKAVCAAFPDRRKGRSGNIAMADFGLSAFAMFFIQCASFLSFQRTLEKGQGRSNCQTLFGIKKIPSDNYIRDMLDEADRNCSPPLWIAFGEFDWGIVF